MSTSAFAGWAGVAIALGAISKGIKMAYKRAKNVFGVGVNDSTHPIRDENGKIYKSYSIWIAMLNRCYSQEYHERRPTYKGCTVCAEWLSYTAFEKWFDSHHVEGWQLDKDLIDPANKEYGPDKCVFVPSRINTLVTDAGTLRNEWGIGAYYDRKQCAFFSKLENKFLGYFSTPEEAQRAYIIAKRALVDNLKPELDAIDVRLYEAIMSRYPLPEPANDPLYFLEAA